MTSFRNFFTKIKNCNNLTWICDRQQLDCDIVEQTCHRHSWSCEKIKKTLTILSQTKLQCQLNSPLNSSILTVRNANPTLVVLVNERHCMWNCKCTWWIEVVHGIATETVFSPLKMECTCALRRDVFSNFLISLSLTSKIFFPLKSNLTMRALQYPSATKKSPFSSDTTDVGLQNRDPLPGLNSSPSVNSGFFVEFFTLNRKTWCSAISRKRRVERFHVFIITAFSLEKSFQCENSPTSVT